MNKQEYEELKDGIEKGNEYKEYKLKNGQLYKQKNGKEVKVIQEFEKEALLWMMHDHPTAAHFASKAMYEKIRERYYWKGMLKDIEEYVKTCDKCQKRNKPIGKHEL